MTSSISCYVARSAALLLLVTFGGYFCEDVNGQRLTVEPSDAVVSQGQLVILQCTVENNVGLVQWLRDGFGLGAGPTFDGFPRYRIDQHPATGVYNLVISNVQLEDDATFQCQVGATDSTSGLRSRIARLTVNVPPTALSADGAPTVDVEAGKPTDLVCRAFGARPAVTFTWRKSGVGVASESAATETVATPGDSKRYDTISRLAIRPTLEDHGSSFRCMAVNSAMLLPITADVQLNVLYAPNVTISSSPAAKQLREFDRVVFTCSAKANPQPSLWRWYKGDDVIVGGESTNSLTIDRIDRSFHGKSVSCEATNQVDSVKQSTPVSLFYGPEFTNEAVEQTADEGATEVTMSCEVNSNPPAVYIWSRDESRFPVLSRGPTLTIGPVIKDTFGVYRCVATVDGYQPISRTVSLLKNGQSEIQSASQQWARFGDTATVECAVRAIPEPKHITWTRDGKPINLGLPNSRYRVEERSASHGRVSLLYISSVQDSDFGVYNCSTDNGYGPTQMAVTLSQQAVVPLTYILAAVAAGLLIIVIICIVVFVYRRRKLSGSEIGSDSSECRITRSNGKKEAVPDVRIEYSTNNEYPHPVKYDTTDSYIDAWKSDGGFDGQQHYSGTQSLRENYNPYGSWNRRSPLYRHPASIQADYAPSHETFNYQYTRPVSKADYRGESVYGPEIYGTLRPTRAVPARVMSPIRRDLVTPYDFRSTMTSPSPLSVEYSQLATNV